MSDKSSAYELSGRTRQKARTRAAMIDATRALLAEGISPTVEQAADRAGISRTTAYRYFRNQRALLLACYPELDEASVIGPEPPEDPVERLELALEAIGGQMLAHEPELRAMLRLSLESPAPDPEAIPLRRGRVIGWFEDALAPLRETRTPAEIRRIAVALRAAFGIEALVWLTDVAGVSRREAISIMRATALARLRSELAERS